MQGKSACYRFTRSGDICYMAHVREVAIMYATVSVLLTGIDTLQNDKLWPWRRHRSAYGKTYCRVRLSEIQPCCPDSFC